MQYRDLVYFNVPYSLRLYNQVSNSGIPCIHIFISGYSNVQYLVGMISDTTSTAISVFQSSIW